MAVGMRILASITKQLGHAVHIFVFHEYKVNNAATLDSASENMH